MASQDTIQYPPLDQGIAPRGVTLLVVTVVMTFLATIFVLLRFTARRRATLQSDDWVCLGALVVAYAFLITTALLVTIGHGGNHMIQFYSDLAKAPVFVQVRNSFSLFLSLSLTACSTSSYKRVVLHRD